MRLFLNKGRKYLLFGRGEWEACGILLGNQRGVLSTMAFTIMDQNRDGFIDKNDLRDTFAALGRVNVQNEEIDDMIKEAPGPINFTVFLTMFGEKLKGADPEETILNAFKVFDPEGKGVLKADYIKEMLTTQAERFSNEEIDQMFAAFPPDVTGNLDYKNLVHIITHGEEKD
ncbi:myosin regulatory light chain 2, ventricular/cardiac muscle isoform isoform X2 [Pipistrellus kuhlii]|uniref:myosin regulatory light chain 2, ventricular/cardiac muscle isoform isoform X2 n=1 Tax=Pipistrellus kuhlii TaxID=59472 RepID=UPI001E273D54|nr:myosin regulatory light chain 2, ventricular/cardiac muscle isoform isoform X2 [Pipistrellus kuhlii]